MFIFLSDWNPQMDLQAMSRSHRLGQKNEVLVLRLLSEGPDENTPSVEEGMLARAALKLKAERTVLAENKFDMDQKTPIPSRNGLADKLDDSRRKRDIPNDRSQIISLFANPFDDKQMTSMDPELEKLHNSSSLRGDQLLQYKTLLSHCVRGDAATVPEASDQIATLSHQTSEFFENSTEDLEDWIRWILEGVTADNDKGSSDSYENCGSKRRSCRPSTSLNENSVWNQVR